MSDMIEITNAGRVRTIRLNRPEVKNALNQESGVGRHYRRGRGPER